MNRKILCFALCTMLLALSFPAEAQQAGKVYRIGVIRRFTWPAAYMEAFKSGLRERGYIEGQNITIETGGRGKSTDRIAELVRIGVHVIVVTGTGSIRRAKKATRTIPIVMAPSADAVAAGLVDSLARPGGNVTGLTMISPDLAGKRLALLTEAVPGVARVAAVFPIGSRSTALPPWLKQTETGARALGLGFQKLGLERDSNTWDRTLKGMEKEPGTALVVIENSRFLSKLKLMGELAARHRLPTMFSIKEHVKAGGLLSYGPDLVEVNRRAAYYVDKILKGANPAGLPVEQPTRLVFAINLKTAKQLGLTIPPEVLYRADKVIK